MVSICDGTKERGTRNCSAPARWILREKGSKGHSFGACDRHLVQVGRDLLNGEQGDLDVRNIYTEER